MYALILAGGRGERLRPLTDTRPKPMVPLNDKPILWYQVEWLKLHGVTDVVFLVSYLWESVRDYFGDGKAFGVKAHYSVEKTPLGRGGGIRQGLRDVPRTEKLVLVTNGDVVCTADLSSMIAQHTRMGAVATDMVVPLLSPYGIVEVDSSNVVTGFKEKPRLPHWINGGVYVFNRDIETLLPEKGDHEDSTFPKLAAQRKLGAFRMDGPWQSVDSFKDLKDAAPIAEALIGILQKKKPV